MFVNCVFKLCMTEEKDNVRPNEFENSCSACSVVFEVRVLLIYVCVCVCVCVSMCVCV